MTQPVVLEASDGRIVVDDAFKDLPENEKRAYMLRFCHTARNAMKSNGDDWGVAPGFVSKLWENLDMGNHPRDHDFSKAVKAYNLYVKCKAYAKPINVSDNAHLLDGHDDDNLASAAPAAEPKASQPPAAATTPPASDSSSTPEPPAATQLSLESVSLCVRESVREELTPIKEMLTDDEGNLFKVAPLDRLEAVEKQVDEIRSVLPKDKDGKLVAFDWKSGKVKVKNTTFSFWPAIVAFVVTFILMLVILTPSTGFLGALYHIGTWGTAALVGVIVMAVMAVLALMKSQKSEKSATTADNDTSKGGA